MMPISAVLQDLYGPLADLDLEKRRIHQLQRSRGSDRKITWPPSDTGLLGVANLTRGFVFGRTVERPLPLSFDRVMETRATTSTATLLNLPVELLTLIVRHIDPSALANLALVSRDCRQLARSRQFAVLHLDYSNRSFQLLSLLCRELKERTLPGSNGLTSLPSLGVCIQRIVVLTSSVFFKSAHLRRTSLELTETQKYDWLCRASEVYHDFYLGQLGRLLLDSRALPHLSLLDWQDGVILPKSFYDSLARSNVRDLRLFGPLVDGVFSINPPNIPGVKGWPLRNLHINLQKPPGRKTPTKPKSTSALCASILRQCSETLESLMWQTASAGFTDPQSFGTDPSKMPCFPKLRRLCLAGNVIFADSATLNALLHAPLRVLFTNTESAPGANTSKEICFRERGCIRTLETFVWNFAHLEKPHSMDFLQANSHLFKLSLCPPIRGELLEDKLLPLLSQKFLSLKSLDLTWREASIPDSALEKIGTIRSLEQIQLSALGKPGSRNYWLVDHEAVREHLSILPRLTRISFRQDVYRNMSPDKENATESNHPSIPAFGEPEDPLRDVVPEMHAKLTSKPGHLLNMLNEANEYSEVFPRLEWIYIGRIQMTIKTAEGVSGEGQLKLAVPVSNYRQDCTGLLNEMFGAGTTELEM